MIPKVIHYCWFGRGEKSKLMNKCIDSWRKYCPDYEIIEWNEDNFDINQSIWTKQAYERKKWAFISDYVRLYVLYNYGGVYCDTDIELIKPIDELLYDKGFSGFEENPIAIQTGIMGSEKHFEFIDYLLSYYKEREFIREDGTEDMSINTYITTAILEKHGVILNGKFQNVDGFVIYPKDYFCPKDFYTGMVFRTENTVCIHHYTQTWVDEATHRYWKNIRQENRIKSYKYHIVYMPNRILFKVIGKDNYCKLKNAIKNAIQNLTDKNK